MSTPKGFTRTIIVITTVTASIMQLIDSSIVNVALSDMSGSFGVNVDDMSWVITSYAIASVIIIPLTGFLAEYFGRKTYYIGSMIIFTAASYMCGQSTGLVEIIIWRLVQGIGGGALLSTSQAILFDAFEPEDQPIAGSLYGMGIVLGPTLGPTLGGYLIQNYSWPLIFMINIPVGIIAVLLSLTFIDKKEGEGKKKKQMHIDYTGIIFLALGVGCLQYVLERGQTEDWFSSQYIRIASIIATVGIICFVVFELKTKSPAVNLKILGDRNLAITTIFTFVIGLGLFTSVFIYPVLAQRVLGYTAYETGLSLLPPSLFSVILMPIMGKMMSRGASSLPFLIVGFILFAGFCFISSNVSPDVSKWDFFFPISLRAIGMSLVQLPLINQAVMGLAPEDYPAGISINNMVRQLGGASGIALANNYVANRYAQHRTDLVADIPNGSTLLMNRIHTYSQYITSKTGDIASVANAKAVGLINASVDKQAYYLSYLDTFRLIGVFFIVTLPFVAFLRVKKKQRALA